MCDSRPDVRHQRVHMLQHHRCDVSKDEGRRRPDDQRCRQEAQTLLEPPHGRLRVCVCVCVCVAGSLCPVHNTQTNTDIQSSAVIIICTAAQFLHLQSKMFIKIHDFTSQTITTVVLQLLIN